MTVMNVKTMKQWTIAACATVLAACVTFGSVPARAADAQTGQANSGRIVVGGKNFTEQLVLSTLTSQYLAALGYQTVLKNGLGSTLMRSAQVNGELDVVWEYTGTSLILYNHVNDKLSPEETYQRVKSLDAKQGLAWLNESGINNTYAIALPAHADPSIKSISDYAAWMAARPKQAHLFASDAEFAGRSDGLKPMLAAYGIPFKRRDLKQMDPGLVYTALHNGQVEAGVVYTTDGRVVGFGLHVLADDKHYFPVYQATPVVRTVVLKAHPQLEKQLNALAAVLDTPTMTALNKQVDIDQVPVDKVAHDFLVSKHLLPQ
ncbi:glycine betaine ABC transporter substrate-binding protein [Robbsia sp. KACC 23696]|uniref:glycine betaine ABC transporter substrate-binding protein n=1 Tax=Robbsia sp. KACC 23696 TaxID=3149231 RepID=UPI00325A849E